MQLLFHLGTLASNTTPCDRTIMVNTKYGNVKIWKYAANVKLLSGGGKLNERGSGGAAAIRKAKGQGQKMRGHERLVSLVLS